MCIAFASHVGTADWASKVAEFNVAAEIASGRMKGKHIVYTLMRLLAKRAERLDSDHVTRNPFANDMPGITRNAICDIGFQLASLAKNTKSLVAFGTMPRNASLPPIVQRFEDRLPNFFMSILSDAAVKEAASKSLRNLKAHGNRNYFLAFHQTSLRKGAPSKFVPMCAGVSP